MKKVLFMFAMLATTLAASAQFEKGKTFVGASLSGFDMNYNGANDLSLGISAQAGNFVSDNLLLYGEAGYQHIGDANTNELKLGVGGRYYILQNGIFLGANCKYAHATGNYNDVKPMVEVGYAFFVSHEVTIEPALYYEQSFKDHSQFSTIGLKVGIGLYHGKDKLKKSVMDAFEK